MSTEFSPRRVIALGFFDGVHLGHQALLREARSLADIRELRCCALTYDRHPRDLLGSPLPLLNSLEDRTALLREVGRVEEVLVLPFTPQLRDLPWDRFVREVLVDRFHADYLVAGYDHRFGARGEGNAEKLRTLCTELSVGCTVVGPVSCCGRTVSSTSIRELLAGGDIREVNRLLGHPHRFTGRVAHGRQLGRKLGFPTVNLPWPQELQPPRYGVYAGRVLVDGRWRPALTNIGVKPTVHGDRCGLESHILDYAGNLYGRTLTVEFTDFLRPEIRFSSVEELRSQIELDIQGVRETLPQ